MNIKKQNSGSALVITLLTILVLSIVAAGVFESTGIGHLASFHSSSWEEALNAAETGADFGMNALNLSQLASTGTSAWTGWTLTGTASFPKVYSASIPSHTGDGNNKMYFTVTVDKSLTDSQGQTWPRIRATGTAELPGTRRVTYERSLTDINGVKNHLTTLRKLNFTADKTGGYCHLPQVSRTIEVIAAPVTTGNYFLRSLTVQSTITMSGGAYTDSFNSSDPTKSTNGQYDQSKRQQHGDIASNTSGSLSNLMNTTVYGNASSNGGTYQNSGGVKGTIYNNFSTTLPPVTTPTWSTMISSPNIIKNTSATLAAGTAAAPANYKLSELTIGGGNVVTITNPNPGQPAYINIWITGSMTTSGSSYIDQKSGVHMTIYVQGDVTVSGAGVDNENNVASTLTIYGVTPSNGTNPKYTVSGSADFVGVVYAPAYNFTLSGSGDFMGAMVMNTANISGAAGFHYDESLSGSSGGSNLSYQMGSWVEDIR